MKEWFCPDCDTSFSGNDGEPCPYCDNGDVIELTDEIKDGFTHHE